jgi:hypothetical protein
MEDEEVEDPVARLAQTLPTDLLLRASSIPTSESHLQLQATPDKKPRLQDLMWYLPQGQRAAELREIFYRQAAWMYNCITQNTFDMEVFARFYDANWQSPDPMDSSTAHRLSILYMVLAIGSLMDTNQPAYGLEAEKYHQLAKASLFCTCFIEEPTLHAVQALVSSPCILCYRGLTKHHQYLMTFYMFLSDRHGARTNARWSIMGVAIKIAQAVSIHPL